MIGRLVVRIGRVLPIGQWLPYYQRVWLRFDLIAGLTLAAYAIPVSLAYASLAGLPPQMGLYCYLLGGLGYALFGTSRHLAIGPTSAISLLVGVSLVELSAGDVQKHAALASTTALADGRRFRCGLAAALERAREFHFGKHSHRLQGRRGTGDRRHAVAKAVRRSRRRRRLL